MMLYVVPAKIGLDQRMIRRRCCTHPVSKELHYSALPKDWLMSKQIVATNLTWFVDLSGAEIIGHCSPEQIDQQMMQALLARFFIKLTENN